MSETTEMINKLTQQPLTKDELASVTLIAKRLVNSHKLREECEKEIEKLDGVIRELEMTLLPDALTQVGLSSIKLDNGVEIEVQPFYSCSVSDTNPEEKAKAIKWLRDNSHSQLIKQEFKVPFKAGDNKTADKFRAALIKAGRVFKESESVNAQTLKSFMKEQLEAGKPFPMDIFRAYTGKKATVVTK